MKLFVLVFVLVLVLVLALSAQDTAQFVPSKIVELQDFDPAGIAAGKVIGWNGTIFVMVDANGLYQPIDSDLMQIAGISTGGISTITSYGRAALTIADAAAFRTYIGAGTSSTTGTVTSASVVTANGVSATVATASTTPAFTFTLGAITPSSVNGLTFTAAGTGFTIAGGTTSKTLTVSNTLTITGVDSSTLNIGTGGTLGSAAFTGASAYATAAQGVSTLSLATPSVLYATPVSFSNTSGAWSGTLTLNTQAANTIFGNRTGGVAAPAFSSFVAGTDYVVPSALTSYVPTSRTVNGHPLNANVTVTNADLGAEPALGNPATNGYVLSSTTAGARSWVAQSVGGSYTPPTGTGFVHITSGAQDAAAYSLAQADVAGLTTASTPTFAGLSLSGGLTASAGGTLTGTFAGTGTLTSETVVAPLLENSWVNFGGVHRTAGYWKDREGLVHLRGVIKNGTTTNGTILFILPVGYRPATTERFPASSEDSVGTRTLTQVAIQSDGAVAFLIGANGYLSLSGISFRTD